MSDKATPRGWDERPRIAVAIRVVAVVVPLAVSFGAGFLITHLLPAPTSTAWGVARWLLVASLSAISLVIVERLTRRLIPLSTLFRLSLAFPDDVPSRFGLALRIGTTMQLRRRIEETSRSVPDETPGEAARRLLELVGLLSRHDRLTRGHSERVRAYAHVIGVEMGIRDRELDRLRWSALLHDIGKIGVPGSILNKPGGLTDDELDIVKTHPLAGKALVEPIADWLGESVRAVWEHHERFDGAGYPQGLSGDDIALASRIVCVADAYDVMTSTRSYKKPMSATAARAELARCADTQFDPAVVRAFLNASIGRVASNSRTLAWLSQTALLPRAIVTQLGASAATTVAVAATAGTLGLAMVNSPLESSDSADRKVSIETSDGVTSDERLSQAAMRGVDDGRTDTDRLDASSDARTGGSPSPTASPGGEPGGQADVAPAAPDTRPDVTVTTSPLPLGPLGVPTTSTAPTTPTTAPAPGVPGTTSPGTVPTGSVPPTGTLPPATVPSVPPVSVPPATVPPMTAPQTTAPPISVPPISLPAITLPPITLPPVSLPPISVPPISVPPISVPPISIPPVTLPPLPPVSLPPVSLPPVSLPPITLPPVSLPPITLPPIALPPIGFP